MITGGDIISVAKKYLDGLQDRANKAAEKVVGDVGKSADEYAFKIMMPAAEYGAKGAYKDAVDAWYSAYSPVVYKRSGSFYNAMMFDDNGGNGVGWEVEETMEKPSIRGTTYDIYEKVFIGGRHGGPIKWVGWYPPTSTPIISTFEESIGELQNYVQSEIYQIGKEYFDEHFYNEFTKEFHL